MGKNQSKEETVIVQSGNSGGTTASVAEWRVADILTVLLVVVVAVCIFAFCYVRCKKRLERKIREEVIRSRSSMV